MSKGTNDGARFVLGGVILAICLAAPVAAQQAPGHPPPPQAFEDCKGRAAGAAVKHGTREGVVDATCVDTPQGLAARPNQPPPPPPGTPPGSPPGAPPGPPPPR